MDKLSKDTIRIALISLQKDAERVPPIGLVYLATYLNERCGIKKENIRVLEPNYCDINEELNNFKPHIFGFSAMTVGYSKVTTFAKELRARQDQYVSMHTPFILGGVHISTLPESLDQVFDVGVIGEGEIALAELIAAYALRGDNWKREFTKIKGIVYYTRKKNLKINPSRTPISNLDDLPIPNFDFISPNYFKKEEIPSISETGIKGFMMTSRGCPYRCVFCSTARFWGCMRFHSPEYTAKLAKSLIEKHEVDFLKVMDDLLTVSVERVNQIKECFDKEDILSKIKGIECQPRSNLMTDELCEAMKGLKIRTLNFGFESGSDKMLKWLKQGSVTVEMNRQAILLCEKYGFNAYGSLIYGSPGETIEDMRQTNEFIDFALAHNAKYLWSFVATPFPATPFWNIAKKRGKVSNSMDWNILSHHNLNNPLLLDSSISKNEFKKVFEEGRSKLRHMKIRMIKDFIRNNPKQAVKMVIKEPFHYIPRLFKQIFTQ
jgi:radical SAM superfamily enzyme YgiQ (UPF0313 family)